MSLDKLALLDSSTPKPHQTSAKSAPGRRQKRTVVALPQRQTDTATDAKAHQAGTSSRSAPNRRQVSTERAPKAHQAGTRSAPNARPVSTTLPAILASKNHHSRVNFRVEDEALAALEDFAIEHGYRPADVFKTAVTELLTRYGR